MGYGKNQAYLTEMIQEFQRNGIRFYDPRLDMIEGAKQTGTDRIELYTEAFAHEYGLGNKSGIDPYVKAAILLMNWDWESMQDTI
jgi:pyridoxine 5-phosphate synthase